MAKSKKQKKSKPKTKAVVEPAIQPSNEPAIPALSKLSSSEPNDQLWAVTTLSNLIQQPENIEQLMQGRIVEKLLNVIGDIDTELNFEALGALRNTLTVVGHSACIELLALGGMSKLLNLIPKMVSYIIGKETPTLALDYNLALEQILSSLWCLGETSEEAVAFLTSTDLIALLVEMLTTSTAPPYLRRTSGQCLNTISESNQLFLNILQDNRPILESVLRFLNAKDGMTWENEKIELALLCGFILVNVKTLLSDDELDSVQSYCFRLIEIASDYDVAAQYKKVEVAGKSIENLDVNSASQSLEAANAVQKLLAPISPEQVSMIKQDCNRFSHFALIDYPTCA